MLESKQPREVTVLTVFISPSSKSPQVPFPAAGSSPPSASHLLVASLLLIMVFN